MDYYGKTHGSLFTGIDGFEIAAERAGFENILHCEINDRLRKMSQYYYPNAHSYANIKESDFTIFRNRVDVLSGGFPCQPFSNAGLQLGTEDERHLWPENLRAVREIQPTWVLGENVLGIVSWNGGLVFEQVQADLENEGYEVQTYILPASGVNAPHRRYRTWFVAYSHSNRINRVAAISTWQKEKTTVRTDIFKQANGPGIQRPTSNTNSVRQHERNCKNEKYSDKGEQHAFSNSFGSIQNGNVTNTTSFRLRDKVDRKRNSGLISDESKKYDWSNWPTQSPICTGDDGLRTESLRSFIRNNSDGVLTEKEIDQIVSKTIKDFREEAIKGGGNAIVPQVAIQLFNAINEFEKLTPV